MRWRAVVHAGVRLRTGQAQGRRQGPQARTHESHWLHDPDLTWTQRRSAAAQGIAPVRRPPPPDASSPDPDLEMQPGTSDVDGPLAPTPPARRQTPARSTPPPDASQGRPTPTAPPSRPPTAPRPTPPPARPRPSSSAKRNGAQDSEATAPQRRLPLQTRPCREDTVFKFNPDGGVIQHRNRRPSQLQLGHSWISAGADRLYVHNEIFGRRRVHQG